MPSDSYQSHFLIIKDDIGERNLELGQSHYSIGRDATCNIRLISQFVSRFHATLEQRSHSDGSYSYHIKDGDLDGKPSVNGLLVNGRLKRSHELQHQDKVVFGPQVYIIYHLFRRDAYQTTPPDEFDITLINPGTADMEEDDSEDGKPEDSDK
jgi:pSer/pThr/pTyr-binding forkhead associated (FHA) protein